MHILIGGVLALALLYFWLLGHWFARVVTFLAFAAFGVLVGCLVNAAYPNGGPNAGDHGGVAVMLLGIVLAWPISGIPIYWQRHQARSASMEMTLR
jgi:hypothetical protein